MPWSPTPNPQPPTPTAHRPHLRALTGASAVLLLLSTGAVVAGDLTPPGGPDSEDSALYTLEDLYKRLETGAEGTKRGAGFAEPASGPTAGTMHDLNAIMDKMPAKDDTDGAKAEEVTKDKTFWGLTDGEWGPKTGTRVPSPVPRTGQTSTVPLNPAPDGSDGDLQKGVAWPNPRFTDNSDGTVTDNLTGLIWLKDASCDEEVGGKTPNSGQLNWADALDWSNALTSTKCGLSDDSQAGDWRLPNIKELQSLVDFAYASPALPNTAGTGQWTEGSPFSGVQSSIYWSSASYAGNTSLAWDLALRNGVVDYGFKSSVNYVWPVRGGQ